MEVVGNAGGQCWADRKARGHQHASRDDSSLEARNNTHDLSPIAVRL
jgi:hypothetical protein